MNLETLKTGNDLQSEIEQLKQLKEAINNRHYTKLSKEVIFLIHSKIEEIKLEKEKQFNKL